MTNFRFFEIESLQTTILDLMKMARSYLNGFENTVVKGEVLVRSNFSFSHCVFKILVLQTRKNQGLSGKGLTATEI